MLFIIFNILTGETYFKTYWGDGYFEKNKPKIINLINKGRLTNNDENYQCCFKIKKDIVFGGIRAYNEGSYAYGDKIPSNPVNLDKLLNYLNNLSNIINDDVLSLKENNSFKITRKIFDERLYTESIPKISLIGRNGAGVSTINYNIYGLTIINYGTIYHIPYDMGFDHRKVCFITNPEEEIKKFLTFSNNIFFIIDSTSKEQITNTNQYINIINNLKKSKKILIIANKQDLSDAMLREEIEKIMGYPTVGFSAIAPDAPERLEEIISDFLKDE